jgi:hypothetical protein
LKVHFHFQRLCSLDIVVHRLRRQVPLSLVEKNHCDYYFIGIRV